MFCGHCGVKIILIPLITNLNHFLKAEIQKNQADIEKYFFVTNHNFWHSLIATLGKNCHVYKSDWPFLDSFNGDIEMDEKQRQKEHQFVHNI